MQEKILANKKHGMSALIVITLLYIVFIGVFVYGAIGLERQANALNIACMVVGGIWMLIGWLPYLGLRVLKPQEALVLTLFGKYVGTIKGDGFFFINPFIVFNTYSRHSSLKSFASPK